MPSPAAFCPTVHFLGGILSGVVFVCGILSRSIMSGILGGYRGGATWVTMVTPSLSAENCLITFAFFFVFRNFGYNMCEMS